MEPYTIKLQASHQQTYLVVAIHIAFALLCCVNLPLLPALIAISAAYTSIHYHWYQLPRQPSTLYITLMGISINGQHYKISAKTHLGFFWIRLILHGEQKTVLWVFKDSVNDSEYRYLASLAQVLSQP